MTTIKKEIEYYAIKQRVEELLQIVNEETPTEDRYSIELVILSELLAEYDDKMYPIKITTNKNE